jgi:TonB-linked SusC/RagA family outer membrane protein
MKKTILFIVLATLCLFFRAEAQSTVKLTGSVIDSSTNKALYGATVYIKSSGIKTSTNQDGEFTLISNVTKGILIVTYLGYKTSQIPFNSINNAPYKVILSTDQGVLNEVSIVSTGYQDLPQEQATGSFDQIDNKLLNRSVSTNILDRLDGVTSGLIFNKNAGNYSNQSAITIRGNSTINANPSPLIVVDNFPYDGDLSSINPNDVASITVLKDAAAAAIWGAFSGNGVIVITTKKGKYNQGPKVEINSNITVSAKPNLFNAPRLSSAHYIAVEKYLFAQGNYDYNLTSTAYPGVSPIIDMLDQRRRGLISAADSAKIVNQYTGQDTRNDESKYLYRNAVNQQYDFNISGGGNNNVYYFSAGFDKNLTDVTRNDFNRVSISGSNTYTFLNKKLELSTAIYYNKNITYNNGITSIATPYPYLQLRNANGNAAIPYEYRQGYIDTAGHGNLLDWNYRPLEELNLNNNTTTLNEYRINTSLRYQIVTGLNASVQYQFDQGNSDQENLYDPESFYVRDYINQFTQYDPTTNTYTNPVPLGGMLDKAIQTTTSQDFRGQLNYTHTWNEIHNLSALAGYEVRDLNTNYATSRLYGYSDLGSSSSMDYSTYYSLMPSGNVSPIFSNISQLGTTNRFLSYFSNLAYTFKDRYILSASARKDESNLFGVATNQKGIPLWSVGGSWEADKEAFYHISWLPYLRLRLTNGYQGNVDNALSSLTTAEAGANNIYNAPYNILLNPPNPSLRWERVNTTNFGADFTVKKFLTGSIDYYVKRATDLIGTSLVDPTTGVSRFTGNSADMTGRGVDVVLKSTNINGRFRWNTTFLFSYTKDKITKYLLKPATVADEMSLTNPVVGNPLYSLYAFKWGGLDNAGDPQVYLDGKLSKDYGSIYNSTNLSNLEYVGPATPTKFGSLRNDFSWKQFSLSVNITYKLGYYFRRPSINYSQLFSDSPNSAYMPDAEFSNRWQNPGDQSRTNVPAMIYPDNPLRDQAYQYSSILIDNADNIRLQDISLGYDIGKKQFPKLPFSNIRIYAYINNIAILWKANKDGIDPDYLPNGSAMIYPNPRTYSLGLKVGF